MISLQMAREVNNYNIFSGWEVGVLGPGEASPPLPLPIDETLM